MRAQRIGVGGFIACLAALAAAGPAQAQSAVMFSSPTKNIGCALDRGGVRCDIRQRDWRPPPKPRSCELDWGFGLTLDRRGRGQFVCAGDTVLAAGGRSPTGARSSAGASAA